MSLVVSYADQLNSLVYVSSLSSELVTGLTPWTSSIAHEQLPRGEKCLGSGGGGR